MDRADRGGDSYPVVKGHQGQIKKAVQLLLAAERPMIYSGGGVILSDSSDLLNKLVNHQFLFPWDGINIHILNT